MTPEQVKQVDARISKAFDHFIDSRMADALGRIKSLEETIVKLESRIKDQDNTINSQKIITDELKDKEVDMEPTNVWKALEANPVVKSSFFGMVQVERNMAQQKERNLVIFGVKEISEPTEVKEEVTEILDAIGMKRHARNAKTMRWTENGPITVSFESTEVKMRVLKEARKLRNSEEYKKVYIHLDLTKTEMDRNKELRREQLRLNTAFILGDGYLKYGMHKFSAEGDEEAFYWGIRRDQLVRIKKRI